MQKTWNDLNFLLFIALKSSDKNLITKWNVLGVMSCRLW